MKETKTKKNQEEKKHNQRQLLPVIYLQITF